MGNKMRLREMSGFLWNYLWSDFLYSKIKVFDKLRINNKIL